MFIRTNPQLYIQVVRVSIAHLWNLELWHDTRMRDNHLLAASPEPAHQPSKVSQQYISALGLAGTVQLEIVVVGRTYWPTVRSAVVYQWFTRSHLPGRRP